MCVQSYVKYISECLNLFNTDLSPVCHLLALLAVHHILHISRVWVNGDSDGCYAPR